MKVQRTDDNRYYAGGWGNHEFWTADLGRAQNLKPEIAARAVRNLKKKGIPARAIAADANPCKPSRPGTYSVPNPHRRGALKPVTIITDRAKRYRANAAPPPGPRQCGLCGSRQNVEIDHVDGHEEHGEPSNLLWACRACNTKKGLTFRNRGRGRLTRQFNPDGARSLAQWVMATMALRGDSAQMSLADAIRMVKATPAAKRSEYAAEIWRRRRARGTDKPGSEIPF